MTRARNQADTCNDCYKTRGDEMQSGVPEFSDLHREVLIFEATWRPNPAARGARRAEAARERFGFSLAQYLRILKEACAHPEAKRLAPSVVRRIAAQKEQQVRRGGRAENGR